MMFFIFSSVCWAFSCFIIVRFFILVSYVVAFFAIAIIFVFGRSMAFPMMARIGISGL